MAQTLVEKLQEGDYSEDTIDGVLRYIKFLQTDREKFIEEVKELYREKMGRTPDCSYFCSCCSACEYDGDLSQVDLRNDADYLGRGVERPICNVFNPYILNHKCEIYEQGEIVGGNNG